MMEKKRQNKKIHGRHQISQLYLLAEQKIDADRKDQDGADKRLPPDQRVRKIRPDQPGKNGDPALINRHGKNGKIDTRAERGPEHDRHVIDADHHHSGNSNNCFFVAAPFFKPSVFYGEIRILFTGAGTESTLNHGASRRRHGIRSGNRKDNA